jgi:hypothetical protein
MLTLFDPLRADQRNNPRAVANWIKSHVPCPDGGYQLTPRDTRVRVWNELRRQSVPIMVAVEAMRAVFGGPRVSLPDPDPYWPSPGSVGAQASEVGSALELSSTIEMWERKFNEAQASNNLEKMNEIIEALLELLYHLAGGKREEFERARRLLRGTNMGTVVQHLTADDLRRLREAPKPRDFPRFGIDPRKPKRLEQERRQRARRR